MNVTLQTQLKFRIVALLRCRGGQQKYVSVKNGQSETFPEQAQNP